MSQLAVLVVQVIADAVSLGHTLNRTVVPPPFLCWCEEDWVADVLSTCTMPGALELGRRAAEQAREGWYRQTQDSRQQLLQPRASSALVLKVVPVVLLQGRTLLCHSAALQTMSFPLQRTGRGTSGTLVSCSSPR